MNRVEDARSAALFAWAQQLMPGGVSSPVRAFKGVGGRPLFIDRGEGAFIVDVDGNRFVDYVLSWGPLILGHAHPEVVAALGETAARGTTFGAPSPLEIALAEAIILALPAMEMVRFVNSGTEATMSALRLARAYTGRSKIVKFRGNYHGHADLLLVQAGTLSGNPLAMAAGCATLDVLQRPGVWAQLEATAARVAAGLAAAAERAGVPVTVARVGTMFSLFFGAEPVVDWASAARADAERYAVFFHALLAGGVYLAPSAFEAAFISTAHGEAEVAKTLTAAERAFAAVRDHS